MAITSLIRAFMAACQQRLKGELHAAIIDRYTVIKPTHGKHHLHVAHDVDHVLHYGLSVKSRLQHE